MDWPKQEPPIPIVKRKGRPISPTRKAPVEVRTCPRHGRVEFAKYGDKRGIRRWRCKRCLGEAVTRRHQKVKAILIAEAGGCCAICGYDRCLFNLHFHHVDPESKEMSMSMGSGRSLAAYREEVKKCVLLCANCHGEVEAGLVPSPPAGARFEDLHPASRAAA